jgi:hypothetical protein
MQPYLIVALPRSRSAWLSSLLSFRQSYCFHDLGARTPHASSYVDTMLMAANQFPFVGSSDPGLINNFESVMAEFGGRGLNPRILFVDRPSAEVSQSLPAACGIHGRINVDRDRKRLDQLIEEEWGDVVHYNTLDETATMVSIQMHLFGSLILPEWHLAKMRTLQVQVKPSIMRAAAHGEVRSC